MPSKPLVPTSTGQDQANSLKGSFVQCFWAPELNTISPSHLPRAYLARVKQPQSAPGVKLDPKEVDVVQVRSARNLKQEPGTCPLRQLVLTEKNHLNILWSSLIKNKHVNELWFPFSDQYPNCSDISGYWIPHCPEEDHIARRSRGRAGEPLRLQPQSNMRLPFPGSALSS